MKNYIDTNYIMSKAKDTNYIMSIAKILESPIKKVSNYNIPFVEFRVQFPEIRKNRKDQIVHLIFWGNYLADKVSNCYQINDYIIIEGYLTSHKLRYIRKSKKFQIRVKRIYPFFLNSSQPSIKN